MTVHPPSPARAAASRLRLAAVLILGAMWLGAAAPRPAVAADDGAPRWTVQTATNSFGAGRKAYGYTLSPGGRVQDGVVIVNQGDEPLRLALRAADAVNAPSGRLGLVDAGARSRGVGAWVRLARDVVTVAPRASVTVPFTLAPPPGARPGDHVGGIVTALAGGGAVAAQRPGPQIRLRVSGALKPGLAVGDVHLTYGDTPNPTGQGDATITYTIHNTGNVILSARQTASVAGPFGVLKRRAGRIPDTPPLLPGATLKMSAPVSGVRPALRLKTDVSVVPLLADAAGSIAPLPAVKGAGHALAIPWAVLVVLGVVAGLAGVAVRRRRRRVAVPAAMNGAVA